MHFVQSVVDSPMATTRGQEPRMAQEYQHRYSSSAPEGSFTLTLSQIQSSMAEFSTRWSNPVATTAPP